MGAWGHGSFENDDAMDWVGSVLEAPPGEGTDEEPGREALIMGPVALLETVEYIEAPDASVALAAIEVFAAAFGKPGSALTADDDGTLAELLSAAKAARPTLAANRAALKPMALGLLDRIAGGSELSELWDETDDGPAWRASVVELRTRLAGA